MQLTEQVEDQLAEQFEYVIGMVIRKEFNMNSSTVRADLAGPAGMALARCIRKMGPQLTEAYAVVSVRNAIREHLAKFIVKETDNVSLDEPILNSSGTYDYHPGDERTLKDIIPSTAPTPEDLAIMNETLDLMEKMLNRFPEPNRTIIRYRYFWPYEGLDKPASFEQLGKVLKMDPRRVKFTYEKTMAWIEDVRMKRDAMLATRRELRANRI